MRKNTQRSSLNPEEMQEALAEKRKTVAQRKNIHIYPDPNEKDIDLSNQIRLHAASLAGKRDTVKWNDLDDIKRRVNTYFEACAVASVYPSISTLAVFALGISRQALNQHLHDYPNAPETLYIAQVRDIIVSIIQNSALRRKCDAVSAIFIQKAMYGFRDDPEPDPVVANDDGEGLTASEVRAKYGELLTE